MPQATKGNAENMVVVNLHVPGQQGGQREDSGRSPRPSVDCKDLEREIVTLPTRQSAGFGISKEMWSYILMFPVGVNTLPLLGYVVYKFLGWPLGDASCFMTGLLGSGAQAHVEGHFKILCGLAVAMVPLVGFSVRWNRTHTALAGITTAVFCLLNNS